MPVDSLRIEPARIRWVPVDKKWWQFWRRPKTLVRGKDFAFTGFGLKPFKEPPPGYELKIEYEYVPKR